MLTEEVKDTLLSGSSVVIERDGQKEFLPAVDETVYRQGSVGNQALQERQMRREQQERMYAIADDCLGCIEAN